MGILIRKLKAFAKRIKRNSRKKDHAEYLWNQIRTLRSEIIDEVLIGSVKGRVHVKKLKHKAALIRKYSRRLKLLQT